MRDQASVFMEAKPSLNNSVAVHAEAGDASQRCLRPPRPSGIRLHRRGGQPRRRAVVLTRLAQAKAVVLKHRRSGSAWLAGQLKTRPGIARRLLSELEVQGIVGPSRRGRNGRAILVEEAQASQSPVRTAVKRRRARQNPKGGSHRPVKASAGIPTDLLSELPLAVALGLSDLPRQIAELKQTAKLLSRLYGKQNPITEFLGKLAAVLEQIRKIRQLVVA